MMDSSPRRCFAYYEVESPVDWRQHETRWDERAQANQRQHKGRSPMGRAKVPP